MDKLCLACLPPVRTGRRRHREEKCLIQGHSEVRTHSEAVGCGVTGLWSVDLDSNPTSVTYQLGAPGCLTSLLCASVSTSMKWNNRVHVPGSV